jgi:SpoVK/Ycf46/Vps4 family AAA+-type ATPase
MLRRLAVYAGSVVAITGKSGNCVRLLLVCDVASDVSGATVVLNPETLELLDSRDVTVSPYRDYLESALTLTLHCIGAGGTEGAADDVDVASAAQLASAFRRQFLDAAVFDRMVLLLRFATRSAKVRVELAAGDDAAFVSHGTAITVLPVAHASYTEGDDEAAGDEAPAQQHVVVYGPSGCGKSHRLRTLQRDAPADTHIVAVRTEELAVLDAASTVSHLREVFAAATRQQPSLVVIDNVDLLCSAKRSGGSDSWGARLITAALRDGLDAVAGLNVRCAAALVDLATLDPALRAPSRFDAVEELAPPATAADRRRILEVLLADAAANASAASGRAPVTCDAAAVDAVAAGMHGFVPADIRAVVERAAAEGFARCSRFCVEGCDLRVAATKVRPSAMKALEVAVGKVRWSDIGGSHAAKTALQECVAWSLGKHSSVFRELGMNPPRGVLLYGPPGCSKTMLAKALAFESGMNFISVKGPEVFSKWVGDSEKAVREIFSRARTVSPCVVFIDELDGMCAKRGQGGVGDRVISQFLTELDGLPAALSGKPDDVVFVAATNRPDNIDSAVLRPGRIDRKVYVGLPDDEERLAVASVGLRGMPLEAGVTPAYIAERTAGYSGAEVIAVCKEAAYHAIAEDEEADVVAVAHVDGALLKVRPRISSADVDWYVAWGKR